jgi:hypothetical protein
LGILSGQARGNLSLAAFGILGIILVVFPDILHGRMPGDTDARFNEYVLEHFYQWITGRTAGFWSAGFFFPFPLTIAFSDNFLGDGFVFAVLRSLGFDREDAFRGWFLAGFAFNFAACAFALTRLGYGRVAAASGAFLFAFGLPVTAQEAHAQLIYRFGVPLATLALIEFGAHGRLRSLCALLFWTVWQFYCSIYIGYFLSLLLIALALSTAVQRCGLTPAALIYWSRRFGQSWSDASPRGRVTWVLGVLTLAALLGILFAPYLRVSALYRFQRSTDEIESMLPHLASYVYSTNSRLWHFSWSHFSALPMPYEQAMFVGVAPFLAIAAAIFLRIRKTVPVDEHFMPAMASILLVSALTITVLHHSLYHFLENTPGPNAIRAMTRIITVLLFPFAVLLASGLDAMMRMRRAARWPAGLIVALLVLECSYVGHYVTSKRDWLARGTAVEEQLPQTLPEAPILMVARPPEGLPEPAEIDAMLLAQQRGWQTFDGYSASSPPGYSFSTECEDAARNILSSLRFLGRDSEDAYQEMARRTVRIGYADCDAASLMHRPSITPFAGPVPDEAMARTRVRIDGLRQRGAMLSVRLLLENQGTGSLPAISTTGTPVRLSAKFVGAADTVSDAAMRDHGWELRQDIVTDILPGETRMIDFIMAPPTATGTYHVAVSVVQDGVAWFHDRGMPIAIGSQTVTADGSIHIGE